MSSKSTKPKNKISVPREMAEISKEYQQKAFQAGQVQYQVKVHTDELAKLNVTLLSLNNEAAARQQLDAIKAAKEGAAPATTEQAAT